MNRYLKVGLLIVDDLDNKKLPKQSRENLFEILMRRYEFRPTIMTSNRPLEEWGKLIDCVLKDRACQKEKNIMIEIQDRKSGRF